MASDIDYKATMSKQGEEKSDNPSISHPFAPPNPNLRSATGELKTLEDRYAPIPFLKDMPPMQGRYGNGYNNDNITSHGYNYNLPPLPMMNEERYSHEDVRGPEDKRYHQYPFPRDEPSPNVHRHHQYIDSIQNHKEVPHKSNDDNNNNNNDIPSNGHQNNHEERKAGEEGPQLISHQSSDDSMEGLLRNQKRSRISDANNNNNNNNMDSNNTNDEDQDEQSPLMTAYTPLSAIESRTFSRDEQLESLARSIINPKGSADGLNLFQSWSFGVPDGSTSFDDPIARKGTTTSRVFDEGPTKPMTLAPNDEGYYYTDSWSHLPPASARTPPATATATTTAGYCQPLHPDQRVAPFTDHLYRHVANSNRALNDEEAEDQQHYPPHPNLYHPYHQQHPYPYPNYQRERDTMPHLREYPVPRRIDSDPSYGSFESTSKQTISTGKSQDDTINNNNNNGNTTTTSHSSFHRQRWNGGGLAPGGAMYDEYPPRHLLHPANINYHPATYHHLMLHPPPPPHPRFNERYGGGGGHMPPPHYRHPHATHYFPPSHGQSQQHQQQASTAISTSSMAIESSPSNTAMMRVSDSTQREAMSYSGNHMHNVRIELGSDGTAMAMKTAEGILLLALPEDKVSLSETLCIVRENIEVFLATEVEVKAPAPGRKRPVLVGQVGLRCIHCRSATLQYDKVKRAVCFPSSLKRIYRTVIDMKLDHFKACKYVPDSLKDRLEELKNGNARSTGTTMQYFVQAAQKMGMVDGVHGLRMFGKNATTASVTTTAPTGVATSPSSSPRPLPPPKMTEVYRQDIHRKRKFPAASEVASFSLSRDGSLGEESNFTSMEGSSTEISVMDNIQYFEGKTVLSLPGDKSALSPLRCFLRENTVAFSATEEDISVRTTTTYNIQLGQVGIGCKHCYFLPPKERSNRAVCFPFSIGRVYQSVADIQRFHMTECPLIPADVKARFQELQDASCKGSKGLATRQYWIMAAKKIGLTDTSHGIRFYRDPSIPIIKKADSLDILAQVASVSPDLQKPLVLDEDKPHIAEFIFEVMKQLQPCRFTDADRNKRRLKDVGCVGVECKHCAGHVDGRKFFWSSVSAVESNFVSVHTHMMECRMISDEFKENLARLKSLRKEQTAKLKNGSQKAFFTRVWKRLHKDSASIPDSSKENQESDDVPPHVSVLHRDGSFHSVSYNSPNNSFVAFASPLSSGHSNSSLDAVPSPPAEYIGNLNLDSSLFVPELHESKYENNQDASDVAL